MKLLVHLGLGLLMATTVVALATAGAWVFRPEWIGKVDQSLTWRHTSRIEREARELGTLAREDPAAALPRLDRLVARIGSARKGDRRYPALRMALRAQAEARLRTGDEEPGLASARALAQLDDRDVPTRIWLGRTLAARPGTSDEGLEVLRALFGELPELGVVARAFHESLTRLGREDEAIEALLGHAQRAPRPALMQEGLEAPWQVWWSEDRRFVPEQRVDARPAVTDRFVAVPLQLPAGARHLRLDPPAGSRLALGSPRVGIATVAGPGELALPFDTLTVHDMTLDADALVTSGAADPWFTFELPEAARGAPIDGRLVLALDRAPRWIGEACLRPAAAAPLAALAADGEWETFELLQRARLAALALRPFSVSVGGAPVEARLGTAEGTTVKIDATLSVSGTAESLELALPPVIGLQVQLSAVEVTTPAGPGAVTPATAEGEDLLSIAPGLWSVTGAAPVLHFPLGPDPVEVRAVRLQGQAR